MLRVAAGTVLLACAIEGCKSGGRMDTEAGADAPPLPCVLDVLDVSTTDDPPPMAVVFDVPLPVGPLTDDGIFGVVAKESAIGVVSKSSTYVLSAFGEFQAETALSSKSPLAYQLYEAWPTLSGSVGAMVQTPREGGGYTYLFCVVTPAEELQMDRCFDWGRRVSPIVQVVDGSFLLYALDADSGLTKTVVDANGAVISQAVVIAPEAFVGHGYDGDLSSAHQADNHLVAFTAGLTEEPYCPTLRSHSVDGSEYQMNVLVPPDRELLRYSSWAYGGTEAGASALLYATSCMTNSCADDGAVRPDIVTHLLLYEPDNGWTEHRSRGTVWNPAVLFFDQDKIVTVYHGADGLIRMTRYVGGEPTDVDVAVPVEGISGGDELYGVAAGVALGANNYVIGYATTGSSGYVRRVARVLVQ